MSAADARGVTIITSTMRPQHINQLFQNYARQDWTNKELIIIVNKDRAGLQQYQNKAKSFPNVRVFRMSEKSKLGACLNYGASLAKYDYIAKFDDDDYYGPNYISEAMTMFQTSKADIVGKLEIYYFFPHRSTLMLRRRGKSWYTPVSKVAGATIMFHKRVLEKVSFNTKVRQGSDVRFIKGALGHKFRVYTTSPYNFTAMRRADRSSHTWKITDQNLLRSKGAVLTRTDSYRKRVNRSLQQLHGMGLRRPSSNAQ
ncbi:glycosyltransferase family 2 protein [Paenibacillus sp. JDR-2]|uniref:glycosyltransferase family 2 protein n=1 Tax=Paenibacillus sp. (strain JDR-2) TaxID=324057 RepID=UPI00016657BB|nr:glycosyltransferase [Paenibacillus sp. JDR-2]ACS98780.1 glycosyl transferase family 2 [Paenibacillus sp. JDR-2]